MSPTSGSRRGRSELEDEEDSESADRSGISTPELNSAKRARTNGYRTAQESSNPSTYARRNIVQDNDGDDKDEEDNTDSVDPEAFQPGAIVRVKVANFVTYEKAEFFPGPNLNMVIGPNGTGKSSLVCAICLGLAFSPKVLGRGDKIAEFVKHGCSNAEIEIELYKKPDEPKNRVVRVKLTREGDGKDWWIDGKRLSEKGVRSFVKSYNIQIDNLCQFLPQDKVSHFSRMSAVELLQQTQRAAAPEEMTQQHEKLKDYRKEQKAVEQATEADRERLSGLENRQENLRAEVQRLEERNQVIEKIDVLKKTIPFVEYTIARKQHLEFKKKKEASQKRFRELELEVTPTLEAVKRKKDYQARIAVAVKARQKAVEQAEADAQRVASKMESLDDQISTAVNSIEAERTANKAKRQEIQQFQRKIRDLKSKQENEKPINFDPHEYNEKIQAKKREARNKKKELEELNTQFETLRQQAHENRQRQEEKKQQLAALDTHEGQQMSKLESVSPETYQAWKWVQEHQDEFEKEVYGPPLITCSIKDQRYTNVIESFLQNDDYMTITVQTDNDMRKLNNQILGKMSLAFVPLRKFDGRGYPNVDIPASELPNYGLDGYALDFIDGPEVVLHMLAASKGLHKAGITLNDINDEQYNTIVATKRISNFTAGRSNYTVRRRAEYGDGAVSTTTRGVAQAKYWVDRPVDVSARSELQVEIDTMQREWETLRAPAGEIREKQKELAAEGKAADEEANKLAKEKAELQTARSILLTLPDKIKYEEKGLEERKAQIAEFQVKVRKNKIQQDGFVLMKSEAALKYRDLVATIRQCHQELLEAEIRHIEAKSDVESLEAKTEAIRQHLTEEREKVGQLEREAQRVKEKARNSLNACHAITAVAEDPEYFTKNITTQIEAGLTVETVEREITAEEAKLEFIHATNPNAIRDFEKRQLEVDKMKDKIREADEKLEKYNRRITQIRSVWEPALDALISEISEAFSYNFEQIGCAGEVGINKTDDFDEWSIEIKVKFRENESLQILDAHRQSGGERSVSTIFYLLALQSLARAPFRVVDEINQGMDPRNERMVHERMVEIACREHTSQYFLITPKLLTGLRYDRRMKVLCIASGEHMPDDYKQLDVKKIISIRRSIMAAA